MSLLWGYKFTIFNIYPFPSFPLPLSPHTVILYALPDRNLYYWFFPCLYFMFYRSTKTPLEPLWNPELYTHSISTNNLMSFFWETLWVASELSIIHTSFKSYTYITFLYGILREGVIAVFLRSLAKTVYDSSTRACDVRRSMSCHRELDRPNLIFSSATFWR